MRIVGVILAIVLVLFGCDKRNDYFGETNDSPSVSLLVTNNFSWLTTNVIGYNVYDSLKVNHDYNFQITISDESSLMYLEFVGDGELELNNESYVGTEEVSPGVQLLKWKTTTVGLNHFEVTVSDGFGASTTYYFEIRSIQNILPQFSWTVEHVGNLDPLEKKIVVVGDDGDLFYGGGIQYWQYIIDNDTTNYPFKEYYYVFPSAGNYDIGVRALDSDNQWSPTIYINNYNIQ